MLEAEETIGGGARSAALTLPGFVHDVCSAIHPLAAASPFLRTLPLAGPGLEWVQPPAALAHPFDDGPAAVLERSVAGTAASLGGDGRAYARLLGPLVRECRGPARRPARPAPRAAPSARARALRAARDPAPAAALARRSFDGERARGLLAGLAGPLHAAADTLSERRLRAGARPARPSRRLAVPARRRAAHRGRAGRAPALARRGDRDRPARRVAGRAPGRPGRPPRRDPAAAPRARRRAAPGRLPAPAGRVTATGPASSSSTGRSPDRSRGATPPAPGRRRSTSAARSRRSPRPRTRSGAAASPSARSSCSRSRRLFDPTAGPGREAHRLGVLPRAERLAGRRDGGDRSAGRAIRARVPRPRAAPAQRGARATSSARTRTTSAATSAAASRISASSSPGRSSARTPYRTPLQGVYLCSSVDPAGRRRPRHVRLLGGTSRARRTSGAAPDPTPQRARGLATGRRPRREIRARGRLDTGHVRGQDVRPTGAGRVPRPRADPPAALRERRSPTARRAGARAAVRNRPSRENPAIRSARSPPGRNSPIRTSLRRSESAMSCRAVRVADGTRTRDSRDHNPGLYQLSYGHRARDTLATVLPSRPGARSSVDRAADF